MGAVGLDWQLGWFAADPPTASTPSMGDSNQVGQLVQAMAGFASDSGGAGEGLNTALLSAHTSQAPLLRHRNTYESGPTIGSGYGEAKVFADFRVELAAIINVVRG